MNIRVRIALGTGKRKLSQPIENKVYQPAQVGTESVEYRVTHPGPIVLISNAPIIVVFPGLHIHNQQPSKGRLIECTHINQIIRQP